jgi:hypothetical protein
MLGPLENEIPAQVGKADQGLMTSWPRSGLNGQWCAPFGARNPLSVQSPFPLLKSDTASPV